jgi:phosphotransferase system enzyme I (PtsI)
MAEAGYRGRIASAGIAIGAAFPLSKLHPAPGVTGLPHGGSVEAESSALRAAITAAVEDIGVLIATASTEAAGILEFQIAMLEDDALSDPAFNAISTSVQADTAWAKALDEQINDYGTSDDDYFRARAADLSDMRDRVLRHLRGEISVSAPPGAVLLAEDLTPSLFLGHDWSQGGAIALGKGSASSHVAMLARMRRVPMVVGLGIDFHSVQPGTPVIVDAEDGSVIIGPDMATQNTAEKRRKEIEADFALAERYRLQAGRTADGTKIRILINVAGMADLEKLDPAVCDGIGLMRTEFLFRQDGNLPDETEQFDIYRRMVLWAQGRPVTIRTLDAGGDKPIAGLTIPESNPFLGLRGVRLSLTRPDVFRVQLRALARAASHGSLKIMLPMVTVPGEVEASRHLLHEVVDELRAAGAACALPPLGIMVEVPSTALTPERFAVDFYSIGSNDLTQYTLAAARDLDSVAMLSDTGDPAVLKLIANTASHGQKAGLDVSLCGDAAAEPRLIPDLLRAGLRSLSVAPTAIGRVKAAVASIRLA